MKKIQSNWIKIFVLGILLILFYRITENYEGSVDYLKTFIGVFTPCIIGVAIAFFLWRPAEKLENIFGHLPIKFLRKNKKFISILSIYGVIIAVIAISVSFIVPGLAENLKDLIAQAPSYFNEADKLLRENEFLARWGFLDRINDVIEGFVKENLTIVKISDVLSSIADSFMNLFLGIVFSVYVLLERSEIKKFINVISGKIFKAEKYNTYKKYAVKTIDLFYSYFFGLAIDAFVVGIITALVFGIFDVPYALFLGVLAAVGNMVPFFGPIVSTSVTFILSAFTLGGMNALWILLFQVILGQLDSNLIQPRILSKSTGVSPLLVLLAVIVFGDLFGFFGMVLGVPLMATIKMLVEDYFDNGTLDASNTDEKTMKGNDINE